MARIRHSVTSREASFLKLSSIGAFFTVSSKGLRRLMAEGYCRQRIQQIMQISMPNLIDLKRRSGAGGNHHVVIRAIVAGIGLPRRSHGIKKDGKAVSQVPGGLKPQIDLRVE